MLSNKTIAKIVLINFQIFDERTFVLTEGLNILHGENNSGKSSIVRAVNWVNTNKPAGEWMCRFDPVENDGTRLTCSAAIHYTDGTVIKRVRGPKENKYIFIHRGKEHEFSKFGRSGIPDPIAEYLGKTCLPLNKDIVPNIAMQDELPFMVFESGPTKGGLINYLTGVDIADKIKRDLTSEVRSYTRQINEELERGSALTDELNSYSYLDLAEKKLLQAMAHQKKSDHINTILRNIRKYKACKALLRESVVDRKSASEALDRYSTIPIKAKRLKHLQYLSEACLKAKRIAPIQSAIAVLEKALVEIKESSCKLKKLEDKVNRLQGIRRKLDESRASLVHNRHWHKTTLKDIKKFDNTECPTCGGQIHV